MVVPFYVFHHVQVSFSFPLKGPFHQSRIEHSHVITYWKNVFIPLSFTIKAIHKKAFCSHIHHFFLQVIPFLKFFLFVSFTLTQNKTENSFEQISVSFFLLKLYPKNHPTLFFLTFSCCLNVYYSPPRNLNTLSTSWNPDCSFKWSIPVTLNESETMISYNS